MVSRIEDRWRFWLYSAVASVPLALFVFASTNPSAWAIAGSAATFPATLAALRSARSGGAPGLQPPRGRSHRHWRSPAAPTPSTSVGWRWHRALLIGVSVDRQLPAQAGSCRCPARGRSPAGEVDGGRRGHDVRGPQLLDRPCSGTWRTSRGSTWESSRPCSAGWTRGCRRRFGARLPLALGAMLVLGLGRLDLRRGLALALGRRCCRGPAAGHPQRGGCASRRVPAAPVPAAGRVPAGRAAVDRQRQADRWANRTAAKPCGWPAWPPWLTRSPCMSSCAGTSTGSTLRDGTSMRVPSGGGTCPFEPMAIWAMGSAAFAGARADASHVRAARPESERKPQQPRSGRH